MKHQPTRNGRHAQGVEAAVYACRDRRKVVSCLNRYEEHAGIFFFRRPKERRTEAA